MYDSEWRMINPIYSPISEFEITPSGFEKCDIDFEKYIIIMGN
jgi:hypothetical protein